MNRWYNMLCTVRSTRKKVIAKLPETVRSIRRMNRETRSLVGQGSGKGVQ